MKGANTWSSLPLLERHVTCSCDVDHRQSILRTCVLLGVKVSTSCLWEEAICAFFHQNNKAQLVFQFKSKVSIWRLFPKFSSAQSFRHMILTLPSDGEHLPVFFFFSFEIMIVILWAHPISSLWLPKHAHTIRVFFTFSITTSVWRPEHVRSIVFFLFVTGISIFFSH